jgi:hypothetical protein
MRPGLLFRGKELTDNLPFILFFDEMKVISEGHRTRVTRLLDP